MNWKNIWENKGYLDNFKSLTLQDLLSLDGFDSSNNDHTFLDENRWIDYVAYFANNVNNIKNKKNILEIGCGAGAFLSVLYKFTNIDTKINAIDYSNNLIKIAKKLFSEWNLYNIEAIDIDKIFDYNQISFDLIYSNSAFQYFNNKEYAFNVIKKLYMLLEENSDLVILDINDSSKENIYHEYRRQHLNLTEEEYKEKYSSLSHLFLDREELFKSFNSLGFKKIMIEDQHINNYANNEMRFNIFGISKKN